MGMFEILRLRDQAQAELAERFDLVGFHDALLSCVSVRMALLGDVVAAWALTSNASSDEIGHPAWSGFR